MSSAVQTPAKRVLTEASSARRNAGPLSPHSAKKRRLDGVKAGLKSGLPGSSQPKSQFEEELEKLSQDISGLKKNNGETGQRWKRPALDNFNPASDSLIFQQIEAEEGTLQGSKNSVKLYGVTEVRKPLIALSLLMANLLPPG
jgi:DNA polymerase delta subunit 1